MANKKEEPVNRRMWMIDPIYRKFTAKAFQNLTGTEFYNYFTTSLMNGEHEFQFSNRKLHMQVDERWVEIIEDTIPHFIEIARNPRVIITQEELITNVVQAKKIDQQVVRHLCAHSFLVDAIDEKGEVVPGKVLNIFKEETWDTYENRFVFTLMKMTYDFISKRYQDMKEAMNDEFGATLIIKSSGNTAMEDLNIDMKMKIKQVDDLFDKNAKHKSIFTRIEEIYQAMLSLMNTTFAKTMSKFLRVTPPLVPTNAIKKNPHLRKCHKLWDFLLAYFDVGYTIEIIEQNPEINEKFEQDIWDDIMFTYIILKGYLEDNRDRAMDRDVKSVRRTLKPRYIKEIVEEIVRNFNMNDVEVRKVLIEELTKEQLMREEQSERYKIVEEQRQAKEEKKRQAELEKIRQAKEAEKQRKLAEKQKERERIQAEKDRIKQEEKRKKEAEKRAALDEKRKEQFISEITSALAGLDKVREEKASALKRAEKPKPVTKVKKAKVKKEPEVMENPVEIETIIPEETEISKKEAVKEEPISVIEPEVEETPIIMEETPESIHEKHVAGQQARMEELRASLKKAEEDKIAREEAARKAAEEKELREELKRQAKLQETEEEPFEGYDPKQLELEMIGARKREESLKEIRSGLSSEKIQELEETAEAKDAEAKTDTPEETEPEVPEVLQEPEKTEEEGPEKKKPRGLLKNLFKRK